MKKSQILMLLIAGAMVALSQPAEAAISLRAGMASPLGDFKDLSKAGWTAQVLADVRTLPVSAFTVIVQFSTCQFGQKQHNFASGTETHTQKSQTTLTGGGIGIRLAPSALAVKPFAELLGRVSSIQQDFRDHTDQASMESKTKVGYEFNAGLRYTVSPSVELEVGGGYLALAKTKLKHEETIVEIAPRGWQVFAGVALTVGL